jgi:hypothetical protein
VNSVILEKNKGKEEVEEWERDVYLLLVTRIERKKGRNVEHYFEPFILSVHTVYPL